MLAARFAEYIDRQYHWSKSSNLLPTAVKSHWHLCCLFIGLRLFVLERKTYLSSQVNLSWREKKRCRNCVTATIGE